MYIQVFYVFCRANDMVIWLELCNRKFSTSRMGWHSGRLRDYHSNIQYFLQFLIQTPHLGSLETNWLVVEPPL